MIAMEVGEATTHNGPQMLEKMVALGRQSLTTKKSQLL